MTKGELTPMLIKVTKWEALRIAGILRSREVVTSQYDWADAVADRIEIAVAKEVERRTKEPFRESHLKIQN